MSSRLFGNSRSADLWSPCLPSRENQTVPAADEGTHLCSGLHCSCHHCWSLCHSSETQVMKTDQSHTSNWNPDQIQLEIGLVLPLWWTGDYVSSIVKILYGQHYLLLFVCSWWYFATRYNQLLTILSKQTWFYFYFANIYTIMVLRQNADKYKWHGPCSSGFKFEMFPCVVTKLMYITPDCVL